jgi:hypothetical protein
MEKDFQIGTVFCAEPKSAGAVQWGFNPMRTVLLVLLILFLLGALPAWPYSHAWGYYPSGGLLIIIVLILLLAPRSPP